MVKTGNPLKRNLSRTLSGSKCPMGPGVYVVPVNKETPGYRGIYIFCLVVLHPGSVSPTSYRVLFTNRSYSKFVGSDPG